MKNLVSIDSLENYDLTDALNPTRLFIYKYHIFPNIIGLNPTKEKHECKDGITFKFDIEKVIEFLEKNEHHPASELSIYGTSSYPLTGCTLNRIEDIDENNHRCHKRIIINIPNMKCIIHSREEVMYDTNHQEIINDYIELYYDDYNVVQGLIKNIWKHAYSEIQCKKTNLYAIKQTMDGFVLTPQVIKNTEVDIDANYNDDFKSAHEVITNFIAQSDEHGIVILNGAMGTGKTHYIRHLINTNQDKTFILGTKNIAEQITEPSFIDFLSKNQNSILILEDCENIVKKRSMNEGSAVTNLLNVGDGLLSDSLKIKIIVTFNTDLKNIDSALQRKGRLRYQYSFENLEPKKSEALLKKLGFKPSRITYPMSLADIYNYDKENNVNANDAKIGFDN